MKVYFNGYPNHWLSPYTIIDYVFFWTAWSKCHRDRGIVEDQDFVDRPEWAERWADRLDPVCQVIKRVRKVLNPEIRLVKIDRYDTWSMDHTLSPIILPMLKQLKTTQHGAGFVDDEDVPEELKSTSAPAKENEWDTDANHFLRWEYVLDEMIYAFEHKADDSWEDAFRSGEHDILWVPVDADGNEVPRGEHKFSEMRRGPNDTYKCDYEGMRVVEARIQNGFRLFGKYYQNLWD